MAMVRRTVVVDMAGLADLTGCTVRAATVDAGFVTVFDPVVAGGDDTCRVVADLLIVAVGVFFAKGVTQSVVADLVIAALDGATVERSADGVVTALVAVAVGVLLAGGKADPVVALVLLRAGHSLAELDAGAVRTGLGIATIGVGRTGIVADAQIAGLSDGTFHVGTVQRGAVVPVEAALVAVAIGLVIAAGITEAQVAFFALLAGNPGT